MLTKDLQENISSRNIIYFKDLCNFFIYINYIMKKQEKNVIEDKEMNELLRRLYEDCMKFKR